MSKPLDPEWCAWFAGFCDGEASFNVNPNGCSSFMLTLRDDDRPILEDICSRLRVGSVRAKSNQNARAKGKKDCDQAYVRVWSHNNVKVIECLELGSTAKWSSWFAGLCDGEACFRVDLSGTAIFRLNLRDDDRPILDSIHSRLRVGSVRAVSHQSARNRGQNSRDTALLTVCGANNLKLIEHLEGRMRTKKAKDFEIWAEAVRASAALNDGRPHPDRKPMMLEYKRRLEEVRKYAGPTA